MKTLLVMSFLLSLVSINAQAKSSDAFFKRFQIVRDSQGKLIGIRDRTLPVKFSVDPYVKQVKDQLLQEQALMSKQNLANGSYEAEVTSALEEGMDYDLAGNQAEIDQNIGVVVDSLKKLAVLNVNYVFSHSLFKEVVSKYQGKMTEAIMLLDPTMIANVNDSTYFYKKNVTYKAVTWGLDFARKIMADVPMLSTVSHVIVKVEQLILERRAFHQNMLLHYLENFKEEELGLTHDEVNLIWSSIYESRIPWMAFWESNKAKSNWPKYGVTNFYANFRMASANLRNAQSIYSEVGERMNYAFQKVTYNNEKVAINLFDRENSFNKRPAVAFNFDRPTQIVRKRTLLSLAELGLNFVPLSPSLKNNVGSFIKSFYEKQKVTEGALYGYFESNKDTKAQSQVIAQYLNPFDVLSL